MHAQLFPVDNGPPVDLAKNMTLIGRSEGCDVKLDHKSVSKIHCVIVKAEGTLVVRDLGSTNGTRVNGTRVRRGFLLPNDHINIAHLKFRVMYGEMLEDKRSPEEMTHQISPEELEQLEEHGGREEIEDDGPPENKNLPPIQTNALPDVYPDDSSSDP